MEFRYNTLKEYLTAKYGCRVGKICIDGGFTCPNRDGTCGVGGCIFCGERGAGEHIDPIFSISEQVSRGLNTSAAKKNDLYIAYFQNFTNTYAPPDVLRERYRSALIDDRIRILDIGTRPDCIDEERADVMAEFLGGSRSVWCELGLQTSNDATAKAINRGYDASKFTDAVQILTSRGIEVIVHMIIGLPGEGTDDVMQTVDFVNEHDVSGVKLHSLYVMKNTVLERIFLSGEYEPISMEDYIQTAALSLYRLRPDIIIHRVTGDCPRDLLAAPAWNTRKSEVIAGINEYMRSHGFMQGGGYLLRKSQ